MLTPHPCPVIDCTGVLEAFAALWLEFDNVGTAWVHGVSDEIVISCKSCGQSVDLTDPSLAAAYTALSRIARTTEMVVRDCWPAPAAATSDDHPVWGW